MSVIRSNNFNIDFVHQVKFEVDKIFKNYDGNPKIIHKADGTPVTEIDLAVSKAIKSILAGDPNFKEYRFYCEEEYGEFIKPLIAVDPIDGTRELIENFPECTVSIAFLTQDDNDEKNDFGWIYNPFTKLEISTETLKSENRTDRGNFGLISRTEWKRDNVTPLLGKLNLLPIGSIAYKLALLASGIGSYVISYRYKNIWDIAAGNLLCEKVGIRLHGRDGLISNWKELPEIEGPLLWCHPDNFAELKEKLQI